jgi:hypothetical protein
VNWQSADIKTDATADEFKLAVQDYFSASPLLSAISVVKQSLADPARLVYTVSLLKRINGVSSNKLTIARVDTKAQITVTSPETGG